MAKLLLEKPDVLLLDEPTNFLDKDHVSSLKDSFTKYTSKATTIGRAQGLKVLLHATYAILKTKTKSYRSARKPLDAGY